MKREHGKTKAIYTDEIETEQLQTIELDDYFLPRTRKLVRGVFAAGFCGRGVGSGINCRRRANGSPERGTEMASFTNQASLTYNGTTINSNIVRGERVQTLRAEKTALGERYRTDEIVTYVVNLRNTGAAALTGLTLTDDLGTYTPALAPQTPVTPLDYVADSLRLFVDGAAQPAPTVTQEAGVLRVTGLNLPAGGVATLAYETRVNEFADPGVEGTIENTVTVTGGGLTEAVTATETVAAEAAARLSITKALSPAQVGANGTVTYTLRVENTGNLPADAAAGIVITDTFDPILRGLVVEYEGAVWPAANYTYNETTGVFTTTPGAVTIPAATYTRDPATAAWTLTPGIATLTLTGTI